MSASSSDLRDLRIAHVIDGLAVGGAEGLLATNLAHLVALGGSHRVLMLCRPGSPLYPRPAFWRETIAGLGVGVDSLDCARRADLPRAVRRLASLLGRDQIDVVHSHLFYSNMVTAAAARWAGVPHVTSLHSLSYEPQLIASYDEPSSWKHDVARRVEAVALRLGPRRVVAVGDAVAASAHRRLHVPRARLTVVLNPVDVTALLAPTALDAQNVRTEIGAVDQPLVVVVGRVMPAKGQMDAVRAIAALSRAHAHLALVGPIVDDAYGGEIRSFVRDQKLEGRVHLLGGRRDVPHWLRAADVFAFPTRYEGLPLSLAEAAVVGCACIASDIPANREVIRSDTIGRLVPVGDVARLAAALRELLSSPSLRASLGRALADDARERFAPDRAASRLATVYREVAGIA